MLWKPPDVHFLLVLGNRLDDTEFSSFDGWALCQKEVEKTPWLG